MNVYFQSALISLFLVGCGMVTLRAETPEEWVKLGARVHGGFGAFIPVGIRIGEDAMKRLNAQPRELSVVYYSGEGVPCPCSVDGVMLAVSASPGQGSVQVATDARLCGICLATAGRDGNSITVRGTFNETKEYRRLDVVARNGGSFVALKDVPGPCPGAGWQLLASPGKRGIAGPKGERGERGAKGDPGLSGTTICDWKIDRARYLATPLMSDGSEGPPLELRELFQQFLTEAG